MRSPELARLGISRNTSFSSFGGAFCLRCKAFPRFAFSGRTLTSPYRSWPSFSLSAIPRQRQRNMGVVRWRISPAVLPRNHCLFDINRSRTSLFPLVLKLKACQVIETLDARNMKFWPHTSACCFHRHNLRVPAPWNLATRMEPLKTYAACMPVYPQGFVSRSSRYDVSDLSFHTYIAKLGSGRYLVTRS
jgi:hypothetical protein